MADETIRINWTRPVFYLSSAVKKYFLKNSSGFVNDFKMVVCEKNFSRPLKFSINNTKLAFLAFLYKIDITGFQNQQK